MSSPRRRIETDVRVLGPENSVPSVFLAYLVGLLTSCSQVMKCVASVFSFDGVVGFANRTQDVWIAAALHVVDLALTFNCRLMSDYEVTLVNDNSTSQRDTNLFPPLPPSATTQDPTLPSCPIRVANFRQCELQGIRIKLRQYSPSSMQARVLRPIQGPDRKSVPRIAKELSRSCSEC